MFLLVQKYTIQRKLEQNQFMTLIRNGTVNVGCLTSVKTMKNW